MEIKFKDYSNQTTLIGSIISLCIGGLLFTKADEVLDIIAIGLGVLIATVGIISLVHYSILSKQGYQNRLQLSTGIILLVVALIFVLFHDVVESVIRYIIGGYIIFTGIQRLSYSIQLGFKDKRSISLLIVSILLILIGVYTIITEDVFLSTIGLIMMIYSAIEIIGFLFFQNTKQETIVEENILINDKEKKSEEKTSKKKSPRKTGKIKNAKTSNEKTKEDK